MRKVTKKVIDYDVLAKEVSLRLGVLYSKNFVRNIHKGSGNDRSQKVKQTIDEIIKENNNEENEF